MSHELYIDISINASEYTAAVEFNHSKQFGYFELLKLTLVEDKSDLTGMLNMLEVEDDIIEQLQARKAEWLQ